MWARGARVVIFGIGILALLSGCGNFSLSSILDGPPGGPTGPTTLTISPQTVNANTGTTITFTATGGVGSYEWSASYGTVAEAGRVGTWVVPTSPDTYTVTVTDSSTRESTDATIFASSTTPLTISPATVTLQKGSTFTFTASGGTPPYTYSMSVGTGQMTPGGLYTTPAGVAESSNTVKVTDSAVPLNGGATARVTLTEPPQLTIAPLSMTLVTGSTYTFTAYGGVPDPGYVYSVVEGLSGGTIDSAGLYTAPGVTGTCHVTVADPAGRLCAQDASITVIGPPVDLSINPNPASIDAGKTLTFVASGGTGPYGFGMVSGGVSIDPDTGEYQAPLFGGNAKVQVTDSAPTPKTVTAEVVINSPPDLQISPSSLYLQTGAQATFSATGGTPTYAFSVIPDITGGTIDSGGLYTAPATEGTHTVRVTDLSLVRYAEARVDVYYPLTIIPTDVSVQTGGSYSFAASGGVPGTGCIYSVVEGTPAGGWVDAAGLYTAPGSAGTYHVTVTDSIGNLSTATVTVTAPAGWDIASIDSIARSGQFASLALDASGNPRIAYYESQAKELRVASWDGSAWSHVVVDTARSVGKYASLALEPGTGNARISYFDERNGELQYAGRNGTGWDKQTVDTSGNVGQFSSIALQPVTSRPSISYYDTQANNLKYAAWDGSAWVTQIVDSAGDVGQHTSLAINLGGNPHIAYYDVTSRNLKHAAWNGSAWIIEAVDSAGDVGQYASLALEPGTNYPRIAYYDITNRNLTYAAWNGSAWIIEAVDSAGDVGRFASLRLDPTTYKPRIAYYNATAQDLKYAKRP